ncbi:uncharacterized protein C16C10.8 [Onthophagus taurus]|uniref:uncharacterized protein C16C10.8 n=1 Tax=Onthophagus taurus TaxID=166361 RepID=UPI0039BE9D1D
MVVFTCNNCGESLQKPKVEKHFSFSCRGAKNLTCVDCFKDFRGEEYVVHTKCITENQRYGSKDYVEKAKKGEVKQESWMEMIKSILMHEVNISSGCKNLLNNICNFTNVPRKKQKFINFIKSSTGGKCPIQDIEGVWDLIEKHKNESNKNQADKVPNNSNGTEKRKLNEENGNGTDENQLRKKKKIINDDVEININENDVIEEVFSLENEIKNIIKKKGNEGMLLEKLIKKVLKKYKSLYGDDININKFNKKFNKKLGKINEVLVDNNIVKLKA